ncbi:uncharacterized protein FFNC_07906 [Fusarium fujikuroi]|nr:uncharacterized protein FFNC_07906 [Fusarium fujikuroi]
MPYAIRSAINFYSYN